MSKPPRYAASLFPDPEVLSVTELTARIAAAVRQAAPICWVSGEISGLTRAASGHCYFTLKDNDAQIRAVLWRSDAARLPFQPVDGLEVICQGSVKVYPPRGYYQLEVRKMEPRGEGAQQLALRQLRERFEREGLFDAQRKRPLPLLPRSVAFITSPSGAAVHDFIQVARRRWRGIRLLVVPTRVQGAGAAEEIAAAIQLAGRLRPLPEVFVVGRGGGSQEDLWCFNEEPVIRAIVAAPVPVVSAVGHEIDVTLADLAADRRALTPSEAAELVIPLRRELLDRLESYRRRMQIFLRRAWEFRRVRLLELAQRRCWRSPLEAWIEPRRDKLQRRGERLHQLVVRGLERRRERLAIAAAKLESLSPLPVLARGYSLTTTLEGRLVRSAEDVRPGDSLLTRLHAGRIESVVRETSPLTERLPREGEGE